MKTRIHGPIVPYCPPVLGAARIQLVLLVRGALSLGLCGPVWREPAGIGPWDLGPLGRLYIVNCIVSLACWGKVGTRSCYIIMSWRNVSGHGNMFRELCQTIKISQGSGTVCFDTDS